VNAPPWLPAASVTYNYAHDVNVERAILGVLLEGQDRTAWPRFSDACPGPGVFWIRNHRLIAVVMFRLAQSGRDVAAMTVAEAAGQITYQEGVRALKQCDTADTITVQPSPDVVYEDTLLAGIGGLPAIIDIATGHAPRTAFDRNLVALMGYATKRTLIQNLADSLRQATAVSDLASIPAVADDAINRISAAMGTGRGSQSLVGCAEAALAEHDLAASQGDNRCAMWGLESMDANCRLGMGKLVILAARPSCGKTSLMLQACSATTKALGAGSVAIVSLETLGTELARSIISREIGVGKRAIERGWMTDDQRGKYLAAVDAWRAHDIPIKDHGERCTIDDITAWIRMRHKRSNGQLSLVAIDYLGLIQGTNPRHNTNDRMGEITRKLKVLVLELQINVLLLCQLNRSSEKDRRPPMLSDLRDSGNIEQDADSVLFLWSTQEKTAVWPVNVTIAKNKNDETRMITLEFMRAYGQVFRELGSEPGHKNTKMSQDPTDDEDHFGKAKA
jgi:replicative DNA helicase